MRAAIPIELPSADDHPLSADELRALKMACAPIDALAFPSLEVMRTLRRGGLVEIALDGLKITERGLERLVRERNRKAATASE